jgi:hypothetical protein
MLKHIFFFCATGSPRWLRCVNVRGALTILAASSVFTALTACSVVRTTADVAGAGVSAIGSTVSTTASVAKTVVDVGLKTVSTAATVGSAAVSAGSATLSAASAAKSVTVATANTAIAGASLVGSGVMATAAMSRDAEISHTPVVASAVDTFVMQDGRILHTQGCENIDVGRPAVLVIDRDGRHEVRMSGAAHCTVVRMKDAN